MSSHMPAGALEFGERESGPEPHLGHYKAEGEKDPKSELLC